MANRYCGARPLLRAAGGAVARGSINRAGYVAGSAVGSVVNSVLPH